jgi:hypothetical protein
VRRIISHNTFGPASCPVPPAPFWRFPLCHLPCHRIPIRVLRCTAIACSNVTARRCPALVLRGVRCEARGRILPVVSLFVPFDSALCRRPYNFEPCGPYCPALPLRITRHACVSDFSARHPCNAVAPGYLKRLAPPPPHRGLEPTNDRTQQPAYQCGLIVSFQ